MSLDPLQIDDLDVSTLEIVLTRVSQYDTQIANIQKERNKMAGILSGHLGRLAAAKGIVLEDYDVNLAEKRLIPKVKTEDPIPKV